MFLQNLAISIFLVFGVLLIIPQLSNQVQH